MGRSLEAVGLRSFWSQRGSSIPEVLVTVSVIAVTLSGSVLALNSAYEDRRTAGQSFANDLRMARMNAVTRGSHYRITWSGNMYTIKRLQDEDDDGDWEVNDDVAPQNREFDGGVQISVVSTPTSPVDPEVEFDTRGMVVDENGDLRDIIQITLTDTGTAGGTSKVEVWPSGQVYLEMGLEAQ
jgi:Tfp pilus assembly protein FimT